MGQQQRPRRRRQGGEKGEMHLEHVLAKGTGGVQLPASEAVAMRDPGIFGRGGAADKAVAR